MIRSEVVDVSEHEDGDRCEHNYAGIEEQCANDADYDVTIANDFGDVVLALCDGHTLSQD